MGWLERILVASDLSACSAAAVRYATFLAGFYDASLELMHVIEHGVDHASVAQRTTQLRRTVAPLGGSDTPLARLIVGRGDPAAQVVQYAARQRFDLVVLGRYGAARDSRWPIGQVAAHIVWGCHRRSVPVLPVSEDIQMPPSNAGRPGIDATLNALLRASAVPLCQRGSRALV